MNQRTEQYIRELVLNPQVPNRNWLVLLLDEIDDLRGRLRTLIERSEGPSVEEVIRRLDAKMEEERWR